MTEFFSRLGQWVEKLAADTPVKLAGYIALTMFASVLFFSWLIFFRNYSDGQGWAFAEGVAVESFGMVFDLIIIGWFVLWLNKRGERQQAVRRYREEISDYLGWNEEEAAHRISGNIKRLNRMGITDIHLRGAYLPKANLYKANLAESDLIQSDLSGAILTKTNLTKAELRKADLTGAKMSKANLTGANLSAANLTGANLTGANLTKANLTATNLSEANMGKTVLCQAIMMKTNFIGANLFHTDALISFMAASDLTKADLRKANLAGCVLLGVDLSGANLTGANLMGANLVLANLTGADLALANLTGADLSGANLTGANLTGAKIRLAFASLPDELLSRASTKYNNETIWPGNFDPTEAGAINVDNEAYIDSHDQLATRLLNNPQDEAWAATGVDHDQSRKLSEAKPPD